MKTLVVDNKTKYLEELVAYLPGEKTVVGIDAVGELKIEEYTLLVLSGGSDVPTVLRHPERYGAEIELVKNFHGAILGICLGCEVLVAAYEGELIELSEEHRGDIDIIFLDPTTLIPAHMLAREAHRIGIQTVPSEFEIIAYSDHSPEIIKHESLSIVGIQFHPEISNNAILDEWLFALLRRYSCKKLNFCYCD